MQEPPRFFICDGCQPKTFQRRSGMKRQAPSTHRCYGHGCQCGSCHSTGPTLFNENAFEAVGRFYIDNTKALIEMVKGKPAKKDANG